MMYEVKAVVDGVEVVDKVSATDPHDAVDVFELYNDCMNNGKIVRITNVAEVEVKHDSNKD